MWNKRKYHKRLAKSISRRSKKIKKERIEKAWMNIWVKAGIIKKVSG
jgi:hypothetical protein